MKDRQFVSINRRSLFPVLGAAAAALISFQADVRAADDPLASWNDGAAKQAIVDFVRATTEAATREYAYGPAEGLPDTKVGTFTQELYDEAVKDGWVVISMKKDWKRVFSFD